MPKSSMCAEVSYNDARLRGNPKVIEPGKLGLFSDLAALCTLRVKYRALIALIQDRDAYVAQGKFTLEGDDRRRRRLQQMRLSKQFPGVLAELEHLTFEGASELLTLLRSYSDQGAELSDDARRGLHLVSDYHFALRVVLSKEDRLMRRLPDSLVKCTERGGSLPSDWSLGSRKVWVGKPISGMETRYQVDSWGLAG